MATGGGLATHQAHYPNPQLQAEKPRHGLEGDPDIQPQARLHVGRRYGQARRKAAEIQPATTCTERILKKGGATGAA